MNITSIQKHYDKLSTVERFTAINAALSRGDESEAAALRRSAPKKTWAISTTNGLLEAFTFLSMWHVMSMQEYSALYWLLLAIGDDEIKAADDATWSNLVRGVMGRALSRHAAWVEVCKEYGADPWAWLEGFPGADALKQFIDIISTTNKLVEAAAVEVNPQPFADDLRAVIVEYRKQWE